MKISTSSWLWMVAGFFFCLPSLAQIAITYPASRAVFQRDRDNFSTIHIAGTYAQPITSVEARLTAINVGQGLNTDWIVVQSNPQGGVFQGPLRAQGGWYRLEVRGKFGSTVVGQSVVDKIGIGEVFIITGQSNAQGFQDRGAAGAVDDRVNCLTYDNTSANSLADPPQLQFRQLGPDALVGPRGQSAWCWGILGDRIAQQYNVPVLFINTAWAGTTIKAWVASSNGERAQNIFRIGTPEEFFPVGMPYGNLIVALRYFSSLLGTRAVLWQQGETDNVPLNMGQTEYRNNMQYLVNKTRNDTRRYPAWVLARSSYTMGQTSGSIINAQNDVINTFNNNVYAGPFTDNIQIPRPDGTHFGGEGLRQLAEAWYASMNPQFFASSIPLLPLPPPTMNVTCVNNQSLTISLAPEVRDNVGNVYRFQDITWSNGQKGPTLTVTAPGTYQAVAKDERNTTFFSPSITVTTPLRPATPSILPDGRNQQVCADSVLTFSTNAPATSAIVWNNTTNARTLRASTAGSYVARAVNVYGCSSAESAPVSLTVRERLQPPAIERVGPYSLRAISSDSTQQFEWRNGERFISSTSVVAKVPQSGTYTARAVRTYTLDDKSLRCYSAFSADFPFVIDDASRDLVVYPNPSTNGRIAVETRENLTNARVSVYTLTGQLVYTTEYEEFNTRAEIDLSALSFGHYVIQVRAAGYNAARRVLIE